MRTALLIGLGAVLLAAGCGAAGEDESVSTTGGESAELPAQSSGEATTTPATEGPSEPETTETGEKLVPPSTNLEDANPVDRSVLEPATTEPVKPAPEPPPPEPEGETVPPAIDHPNPQVVTAMNDLVQRLEVDPASIEVVAVEEVTWPDGSIGCPQPDMRYTQALVNGSRIVLRVGGVQYQYNSGGGREPFYCANPGEPVPGGGDYGDI